MMRAKLHRKFVSFRNLISILVVSMLLLSANVISHAITMDALFKTDSSNYIAQSKPNETSTGAKSNDAVADKEEEEEVIDPTQVYKLIAVYLIGKQPRALIVNELEPEEGSKEYKAGDYVDEEKTLSITRISMLPTARIELIDKHGLTFLMKPHTVDTINSKGGSKYSGSSAFPTYSSGTKSTTSSASKNSASTSSSTESSSSTASQGAQVADTDASSKSEAASADAASAAATPSPASPSTSEAATPPPSSGGNSLDIDDNRPANPFGD